MKLVAALVLASLCAAPVAHAAPPDVPDRAEAPCVRLAPGQRVLVDLREAPLSDVARFVSCATGTNILFAPATLGGKLVTVYSVAPVDRRGLLGLWSTLLRSSGLVSERRGAYVLIRSERP